MSRSYYYKVIQNPSTGQELYMKAADRFSLAAKIERQYERWERERVRELKAEKKQQAIDKTGEAQADIAALKTILHDTLKVDDRIDWQSLLDRRVYPGMEPQPEDFQEGSLSKSLSFISAFRRKAEEQAVSERKAFEDALAEYSRAKGKWESEQKKHNSDLARKKMAYEKGNNEGVAQYVSMVLDRSEYPDVISVSYELIYDDKSQILVVEIELPAKETIPHVEAYRYIATKDSIESKEMKGKEFAALYDEVQYQIVLRTIHEVFESDYKEHVKAVVVNGNTDIQNKGTGKVEKKAIMTIQVGRAEFLEINLENVDPAQCFRHFKGITAGSLVDLTPVRPIMKLDRKDDRIIEADDILEEFDPTQNLAVMEWEKFEVLIRDLIQKEFSGEGATVEVTRASRDAGVDAIAFDEDPIRGGKFVIQAKRYNNLVPLSAVRDLYGTVHNEGAVKGILVTTSYYGPDAISFAKDKPLTLINGEQLLYMFQKHGFNFKIQLQKKHAASKNLV